MGLLTNLWKLVGPTWPSGYCPTSNQEYSDFIINGTQVTFLIDTGNFLYNYGSATPAPENRIFPWYNTTVNRWYNFQGGLWASPVNPSDLIADFVKLWVPAQGTLVSALFSLDEGDGTDPRPFLPDGSVNPSYVAPTDTTGAMWTTVDALQGRVPIGVGEIPDSDLGSGPASVGPSDTQDSEGLEGEYAHLLTDAEGSVGNHTHPYGLYDTVTGSGGFAGQAGALPVAGSYDTLFIGGTGPSGALGVTTANMFTMKAAMNAGVTSVKHNTMQPYLGVWFITHTSRKFYTLPA